MRIIDAYWELRNLGITAQEVEIDKEDTLSEVQRNLRTLNASYQVVKTPTANLELYKTLMELGFSFVETIVRVSYSLNNLVCSQLIKRISDVIEYQEMSEYEITVMEKNIRDGMFRTDRVVMDSVFTRENAANRYIMWMRDERENGSTLYRYIYKGESIGFTCIKETDHKVFYPVLGGIYSNGKVRMLGSAIVYKQLEIAKELGGKELYTYISTSNPVIIKTYSQLGYTFEDIRYVFVKHYTE